MATGKPLRILVVNHRDWLNPRAGGVEEVLAHTLPDWVRAGHRVQLLVSDFPGDHPRELTLEGVAIRRFGDERIFNWLAPWFIRRHYPDADVIVEHLSKVACLLPWLARVPVVGQAYHFYGRTLFQSVAWPVAAYVVAMEKLVPLVYGRGPLIVISKSTVKDLARSGFPEGNMHVVYCGVNREFFQPVNWAEKTAHPSLLWVGRIRKAKGVAVTVDAFARVARELPAARLTIVGRGDYEAELRQQIATLGLQDKVRLAGFLSTEELVRAMREAWVLTYSSPKEGWGLCVTEAGACGTPSVASNVPGLCESVRDGETGFLVPHGDVPVLTDKLLLLLRDEALRRRMSAAARTWAESFRWETMASQTLAIVEEAARGRLREQPPVS
jgi:glycosyltransferase involved in cell wall biosynthesis